MPVTNKSASVRRVAFLKMDGGATGAAGPHVLCLAVKEHIQGQGHALVPMPVDDLVRETVLQMNTATCLHVQLGDRGAAGPAASPVEEEQSQGRAPVLRQAPRVQVTPVKHKIVRDQSVVILDMESGTTGAAGLHVLCLVVKEHVQGQGRVMDLTPVDDLVKETVLQLNTATCLRVQVILQLGDRGAAGHAASPVEQEQCQGRVPVLRHPPRAQVMPVTNKSARVRRFLKMDGGTTGAAGPHVLCLVVKEHVQGQGRVMDLTPVDDPVRETILQRKSATCLRVQLGDRGAAGHAASPVEEEQNQGRAPVLRQAPRVQVTPVKHKSVRDQSVVFLDMESGTTGAAGLCVLCLVVKEHVQGQGRVPE
ncbi:hypothetical protein C0Q70_11983 [Pomacea canaliculata]|uniref:Uncharacterized protein n=1 Tax=Pomacea canaliculata TaxID=400727 RepID=A0A2T7P0A3_POMCA|nr:hypothetical protein C0Q70_11983 [Pomacea canaliculata]